MLARPRLALAFGLSLTLAGTGLLRAGESPAGDANLHAGARRSALTTAASAGDPSATSGAAPRPIDIRIDLGTSDGTTGGNWNDISNPNGTTFDLVDFATGLTTPVSIQGTTGTWLNYVGDESGEFPERSWIVQPAPVDGAGLNQGATGTFVVAGLGTASYRIEIVSARTCCDYLNTITVDGQAADRTFLGAPVPTPFGSRNDGLTPGDWLIWDDVVPAAGSITITDVADEATYGILNAIRIVESPRPLDLRLDLTTYESSTGGNWNDISAVGGTTTDLVDFHTGMSTAAAISAVGISWEEFHGDSIAGFPDRSWLIQPATADGAGLFSDSSDSYEITGLRDAKYRIELVSARDCCSYLNFFLVAGAEADRTLLGNAVPNPFDSLLDGQTPGDWLIWDDVSPTAGAITISDATGPSGNGILNAVRVYEIDLPFLDGFESGDTCLWSSAEGGCP